ncbi:MAG: DUF5074 domain-containing protein [Leadbetterella sp.]
MKKVQLFTFLVVSMFLVSCSSDDDNATPSGFSDGVMIVNEGNFLDNNGSISFLKRSSTTAQNDLFKEANKRDIFGGIRGYGEVNGKGIILVDNSSPGKDLIEIVNAETFMSLSTIPSNEIENPRKVLKISETKAYVLSWGATGSGSDFFKNPGYIAILDMVTNKISKKITLAASPKDMILIDGNLVVTFNTNNNLQLVNPTSDVVGQTFQNTIPFTFIGFDKNNLLWAYSSNSTTGTFYKLNTATFSSTKAFDFQTGGKNVSMIGFNMDKSVFYFGYFGYDKDFNSVGTTHSVSITDTKIDLTKKFSNKLMSSLTSDTKTGQLYGTFIPTYKQAGFVFRMDNAGVVKDSVKVGIGPASLFFK